VGLVSACQDSGRKNDQGIEGIGNPMRHDRCKQIATTRRIQERKQRSVNAVFDDSRPMLIGMGQPKNDTHDNDRYCPARATPSNQLCDAIQYAAPPNEFFSNTSDDQRSGDYQ
jgi:hypothetical protein